MIFISADPIVIKNITSASSDKETITSLSEDYLFVWRYRCNIFFINIESAEIITKNISNFWNIFFYMEFFAVYFILMLLLYIELSFGFWITRIL